MQIIVTHTHSARTRVWTVHPLPLFVSAVAGTLALLALVGAAYHFVFLKGAREGWPVVSQMLAPFTRTEFVQRDRYLRENLDAMASKLGELQAKLLKLEAVGERVSGLAGLKPEDFNGLDRPAPAGAAASAAGGPYVPLAAASLDELGRHLDTLDHHADLRSDVFTLIESRLLEAQPPDADGAQRSAGRSARSARASASASTPSPHARRCTPGWTSRRRWARRSAPPPAAWCRARPSTAPTASPSRSTTATAWSPATPTCRASAPWSAGRSSRASRSA